MVVGGRWSVFALERISLSHHFLSDDKLQDPLVYVLNMADSWEEEDFDSIELGAPAATSNHNKFDDEEEEVDVPVVKAVDPAVLQKQREAQLKKEKEDAAALAAKLKLASLASETADQRKLRERLEVESADIEASSELFSSGVGKSFSSSAIKGGGIGVVDGIASVSLKNIKDHETFASTVSLKLEDAKSTSFNISAFFVKLTEQLKDKLTSESLDAVLNALAAQKEKKKLLEPKNKTAAKKTVTQIKKETKRHADIFGGGEEDDKYANYEVNPLSL